MKKTWQPLLILAVALVMVVVIIRTLAQVRGAPSDEEEEKEEGIKTPSRVSLQNGQTVITLDPETQSQIGITVTVLNAVTARKEVAAPAVVLSAQELVTARNNYIAAQTALEKAEASVQVLQQES